MRNLKKQYQTTNKKITLLITSFLDNHDYDYFNYILLAGLLVKINKELDELKKYILKELMENFVNNFNDTIKYIQDTLYSLDKIDLNLDLNYNDYIENPRLKMTQEELLNKEFEKLKKQVQDTLITTMNDHEIPENITKRVRDLLYTKHGTTTFGNLYKSVRIMKTETTRMRTKVKYDACTELLKMGYDVSRVWIYTWESITQRSSHVRMHGVRESKDRTFTVNGHTTIGPGWFGIPSEDINCGCDTEIILTKTD